ncbi:MAG: anti-sigma factor domain-containing protein [Heyndrickxia sp.]
MRKGVILEIKKKYLVMLTPEGEFLKGTKPHDNLQIGEEISFDPYLNKLHFPLVPAPAKIGSLAVVSVLIICALLFNVSNQNKAYAYVSIDANPSVELVLNKNLQVIRAKALNQDGKKVLSKVNVEGKQDFEYIAKQVLLKSKSLGYIDDNSNVVIASVIKNQQEEKSNKRLEKKVQELAPVAKNFNASIKVVNASMDERKDALKSGVSTGKYVVEKQKAKQVESDSTGNIPANTAKQKVEVPKNKNQELIPKKNEPIKKNIIYWPIKPERNNGQQKKNEKRQEHEIKMDQKKDKKNHPWSEGQDNRNQSNNKKWENNHWSNLQDHRNKDRNSNDNKQNWKKGFNNGNHFGNNKENERKGK